MKHRPRIPKVAVASASNGIISFPCCYQVEAEQERLEKLLAAAVNRVLYDWKKANRKP